MTHDLNPRTESHLKWAIDVGERVFSVILFAGLVLRMSQALGLRPWDALVLVSEGLVVLFMVVRRGAPMVTTRPLDWLLALVGTTAPMLVRPGGHALAPPVFALSLMICGLLLGVWGKLILRRSFGLAAANRGVVQAGPYGFVRHPIYAGYLLVYAGFFLANPLGWNAGVYVLSIAAMVYRVLAEERILAQDPAYASFMTRVRFRLAPGLF